MATTYKKKSSKQHYYSQVDNMFKTYQEIDSSAKLAIQHKKLQSALTKDSVTNKLIENYVYLYHLPTDNDTGTGQFVIIPSYPENYTDNLSSTFSSTSILARSAPIFAYSYSGPRTITINLSLHRDMMTQLNYGKSNLNLEIGDDYVDTLINKLQSMALPKYDYGSKMVNPPMVAVRFGNEFFIKGVVTSGISVTGQLPLLQNGKYAQITIQFTISEVDPYDAETVVNQGSIRGLSRTLERNLYKS